jgi:hypothetical protein
MAAKRRAEIPDDTFKPQSSPLERLSQSSPGAGATRQPDPPVRVKEELIKKSVYMTAEEWKMADDLAAAQRRLTGDMIKTNDLLRQIVRTTYELNNAQH